MSITQRVVTLSFLLSFLVPLSDKGKDTECLGYFYNLNGCKLRFIINALVVFFYHVENKFNKKNEQL